jgi:hypothetical protein
LSVFKGVGALSHLEGRTWIETVFENMVLRRIFGSKLEEVMEGWRRKRNEELHYL